MTQIFMNEVNYKSIINRALRQPLIEINCVDIRNPDCPCGLRIETIPVEIDNSLELNQMKIDGNDLDENTIELINNVFSLRF